MLEHLKPCYRSASQVSKRWKWSLSINTNYTKSLKSLLQVHVTHSASTLKLSQDFTVIVFHRAFNSSHDPVHPRNTTWHNLPLTPPIYDPFNFELIFFCTERNFLSNFPWPPHPFPTCDLTYGLKNEGLTQDVRWSVTSMRKISSHTLLSTFYCLTFYCLFH